LVSISTDSVTKAVPPKKRVVPSYLLKAAASKLKASNNSIKSNMKDDVQSNALSDIKLTSPTKFMKDIGQSSTNTLPTRQSSTGSEEP